LAAHFRGAYTLPFTAQFYTTEMEKISATARRVAANPTITFFP
jgi:hypothetical protein